MIRNDIDKNKNDQLDNDDKICKSPRVVLQRLNIPLDSVVIVKGDTVYTLETTSNSNSDSNSVIDITISDDEIDENVDLHEMIIRRYNAAHNVEETADNNRSENITQRGSLEKPNPSILKHQEDKNNKKMNASGSSQGEDDETERIDAENAAKEGLRESENDEKVRNKIKYIKSEEISSNKDLSSNESEEMSSDKREEENSPNNESISLEGDVNNVKRSQSLDRNENDVVEGNNNTDINSPHEEVLNDPGGSLDQSDTLEKENDSKLNKMNILDSNFTPSRTSERIKNKKEKFSALKLLAGGSIKKLKREINSDNSKRISSIIKKSRIDAKSVEESSSSVLTPQTKKSEKLKFSKIIGQNEAQTTPTISLGKRKKKLSFTKSSENNLTKTVNSLDEVVDSVESSRHNEEINKNDKTEDNNNQVPSENVINRNRLAGTSPERLETDGNKTKNVEEKRETIKRVSDRITLKLEGPPQKKIVNISVSPKKDCVQKPTNLLQKLNVDFGPDIIIKRVKSDKSQSNTSNVQANNNNNNVNKDSSEGNNVTSSGQVVATIITNNPSADENTIKTIPRPEKEVDVPPQIKKLLVETINKNKKSKHNESSNRERVNSEEATIKNSHIGKKKTRKRKRNKNSEDEEDEDDEENSENECSGELIIDDESEEVEIVEQNKDDGNSLQKKDGKYWENKRNNNTFSTNTAKIGGKKTAKVTPLRLNKVQPKPEIMKKTINDKNKLNQEKDFQKIAKSKHLTKTQTQMELTGNKRFYKNTFDRYFISTEKIYEHNDSLDSDSDNEPGLLSHFIDLNKKPKVNKKDNLNETNVDKQLVTEDIDGVEIIDDEVIIEDSEMQSSATPPLINRTSLSDTNNTENINNFISGNRTINDLIKGIADDLPKWNLHIVPESSVVCLILLDRESGMLDVKKCIEIDCNFKANVYVDKIKVNEYCGVYDSFDAIKNLIYQIDLL